jgi:quinol monooxygenase YgiN
MIIVTIALIVLPEKRQELLQTISSLNREMAIFPGFKKSRLFQDLDHPTSLTLVEEWETERDLQSCIGSDSFNVLMGALRTLGGKAEIKYDLVPDAERVRTKELKI